MSYAGTHAVKARSGSTESPVSVIQNRAIRGTFQVIPSEVATEILGRAGADFVIVDGEHSVFSIGMLAQMARAGETAGVSVLYRAASSTDDLAKALDTGIAGLVVPRVESASEAEAVVRAVRFPPLGARGLGPGRASLYGLGMGELRQNANQEVMLVLMVETQKGLDNLESIVAVPGVDVIMVGPADLASSMDVAAGKHVGVHCANAADVARRAEEGYRFLPASLDTAMLFNSAAALFNDG
jgi:4-hydroxy-2-oxoheptanedioate aldolase